MKKIIPVILCGGAGSRLWPVSRALHPKPFIRLQDGQSLLQKAFLRGAGLPGVEDVVVVTNRDLYFKVEDELQAVNARQQPLPFLLEPEVRNTAGAIAMAVLYAIECLDPDAVLLVLPADHLVMQTAPFQQAVMTACELAKEGRLVLFGIQPTSPETGYGYIEAEGHTVRRFIEKPPLSEAKQYLASGRFFWNSGMFCFTAETALREMTQHCPDILEAAHTCLKASLLAASGERMPLSLDAATFARMPALSIDYALMEKSTQPAVIPCDIGWSDIGSWDGMSELSTADAEGNRVVGHALLQDARNCYIHSEERLVSVLGVDNLMVVDTPDALLVADRSRAQEVRQVYSQLEATGHEAHKLHRTVHRPWGTYTVLQESAGYKVKRIEMKPNASLSLQTHQHRSEHWIVVSGRAEVVNGDQVCFLQAGESTFIPAGNRHRLSNPGGTVLVIVEVQCGDYLGEDDIVRLEDVYGRV